jgi:cell wall-active antibiotic response 4TMS protein YvqF
MNSWLLIRRLRGPAFLILFGITALLSQWGVLSFSRSWPLYLILAGVIGLAERAAILAAPPAPPVYPYASTAYPQSTPVPPYVPASGMTGSADPNRRP